MFKIVSRIGTCDAGFSSSKFRSSCLPFVVKQSTFPVFSQLLLNQTTVDSNFVHGPIEFEITSQLYFYNSIEYFPLNQTSTGFYSVAAHEIYNMISWTTRLYFANTRDHMHCSPYNVFCFTQPKYIPPTYDFQLQSGTNLRYGHSVLFSF